jgi:hypothetical protein
LAGESFLYLGYEPVGQKFRGKTTLHRANLTPHEDRRSLAGPGADSREQALPVCRGPVYPERLDNSIQRACPGSHVSAAAGESSAAAGESSAATTGVRPSGNSRRRASAGCNPCGKMRKVQRPPSGPAGHRKEVVVKRVK